MNPDKTQEHYFVKQEELDLIQEASPIQEAIYRLNAGRSLGHDIARDALEYVLNSPKLPGRDVQLGVLLNGLMARGTNEDEVAGLVEAAFSLDKFDYSNKSKIELPRGKKLVGAVGSGKKGYKTMNISTAAMIVASANDVYTAKPGSCSTSSITGSADIMRAVGANIDVSKEEMIRVVQKTKFGLFVIESQIPKFDSIYGKKFLAPHALSVILPALVSPVQFDNLLFGLSHSAVKLSARTFKRFGINNVMIVSNTDDQIHYLDEIGVFGVTRMVGIKNGKVGALTEFQPAEVLDFPKYTALDIAQGASIEENVAYFVGVLANKSDGARQDIVCINSGALMYLAGEVNNLEEGYRKAKSTIASGSAKDKLVEIIEATGGSIKKIQRYL